MLKFSVLMSVYVKENANYLTQSLNSILVEQTVLPSEVVLVKDGPLTHELENVINVYKEMFPEKMKIVSLDENKGLGKALSIGLKHCEHEIVARMDSDDISDKYRFEKQISLFENNAKLDVIGGCIAEFYEFPSKIIAKRKVPNDMIEIVSMMRSRNPMNHVSVMFKKGAVIEAGGYQHLPYLEDYYLWIRMVDTNKTLKNIDDVLVYTRTGQEMYKRRGNKEYIRGWYILQKKLKTMHLINRSKILINMCSIIGFIYMPPKIKELVYKNILRA